MKLFKVTIQETFTKTIFIGAEDENEIENIASSYNLPEDPEADTECTHTIIDSVEAGEKVYWTDPDEESSGEYHIVKVMNSEVVLIENDRGSEAEVYLSEIRSI